MQPHSSQIPQREQPMIQLTNKPNTTKATHNNSEKVRIPKISDFKIQPLFKKNFEAVDDVSHGQRVSKYLQLYGEIESKKEQLMGKDSSPQNNTKSISQFGLSQKNGSQQKSKQASTSQQQKRQKVVHKAIRNPVEQSRMNKSPDPLQEQVEIKQQTDQLVRRLEQLTYIINKARSDKLELERDLATYEYYFCQHYGLRSKLSVLKSQTQKLSQLSESIDDQMANQYKLQTYFNQQIETLNQNELVFQKRLEQIDKETLIHLEDESKILRDPDLNLQQVTVHQQVLKISNIYVIVSVKADKMLNSFSVLMQNQKNGEFYKQDINFSIEDQSARENAQARSYLIQTKFLKYFFFISQDNQIQLNFNENYGKD